MLVGNAEQCFFFYFLLFAGLISLFIPNTWPQGSNLGSASASYSELKLKLEF